MAGVRGQKLSQNVVESRIFTGLSFCMFAFTIALIPDIIKGNSENSKAQLEELVHKHGGEFSQAQLSDLSAYVIAPDEKSENHLKRYTMTVLNSDVLVRAQKKKGVSIIKPQWIHESIKRGRQLPLIKRYAYSPSCD